MRQSENLIEIPALQASRAKEPLIRRILRTVHIWQQRVIDRAHLASLDDRDLKDVGLSRTQIDFEIAKPFWRP